MTRISRGVARAIDAAELPTVTLLIGMMMLFGVAISAAILLRDIAAAWLRRGCLDA